MPRKFFPGAVLESLLNRTEVFSENAVVLGVGYKLETFNCLKT